MRMGFDNVGLLDDGRMITPNLAPGIKVYDEDLLRFDGREWRTWNPTRSKIGAYLLKGAQQFPIRRDTRVLYLGAANGTTPSHISDIVHDGVIWGVEFSPRSFRDLVRVASQRPNLVPLLYDAWRPEAFERFIDRVDVVFQDIAQREQGMIFLRNLERFAPEWGLLAVKARSVDVAKDPRAVYSEVQQIIEAGSSYRVVESVTLDPYEKDHACILFRRGAKN
ncbi:MAG: fibrillarin-like rRNA/tRNA 2'-O-methyltransferase [Thermoplasmatota archaeon]